MTEELLKYFNGDELAASTWLNKYAYKDEKTPTEMHRRMAKEFARIEQEYNNPMSEEEIFELFDNFKYVIPGGSVMAVLGTDMQSSLSNCSVIESPKDSISGIMDTAKNAANLFKRRFGVGFDISTLRPSGSKVNNSAKTSTGAASFMDLYSMVTNTISQNSRRGALMLTISINHPDVLEFIQKKQDLTKVTGANISVKVTDEFMKAVLEDKDYLLRWPVDYRVPESCDAYEYNKLYKFESPTSTNYIKRIKAKELWKTLMHCAWNTAEPGIIFEDRMINYAPDGVYPLYKMVSTNPCQPSWATVLTPNGISTIGNIKVGDKIWSKEGWTTVINKISSGIKDVYEYRTTAGSFYGTENHKIISKGVKVEAKDAKSIDLLAGYSEHFKNLDPQAIMDGLVLGDGSVHKASNNLVYLCIGKDDEDYFSSEIQDLIIQHRPGLDEYAYEIKTTIIPDELPYTFQREIPERYFKADQKTVLAFLRGLYSANGSVVKTRVTFKTASSKLRDQLQILLSSVGIRSYYTTNKSKRVKFSNGDYVCKESYDVNISTDRDIFYENIGFLQDYKMKKLLVTLDGIKKSDKHHDIISTTYLATEEVFDITVDNKSHTYWTGGLNVSNCGEIGMGQFDSCRLLHINLTSLVKNPFKEDATFDYSTLKQVAYKITKLADDLVDLEIKALEKIKLIAEPDEQKLIQNFIDTGKLTRRLGVGFTGLADTLAMLNLPFSDSLDVIEQIMYVMFEAELRCTIDMGKERGAFNGWQKNLENLVNNEWYQFVKDNYPDQYEQMQQYGRRNISFSTVAPTGTVSLLARCSSGIEPVFMPYYTRRRKVQNDSDKVDFVDVTGQKFTNFKVIHPNLVKCLNILFPDKDIYLLTDKELDELISKTPYAGQFAGDIDWHKRIKLQGVVQKYITHSISSTINLPEKTTEEEIADIYIEAWKAGNKGQTIYRQGCRDGVLVKNEDAVKKIVSTQAPKRGRKLIADYYETKVKGETFIVLVGLMDNRPYEIFAFRPNLDAHFPNHQGIIVKQKKMHYMFTSDKLTIPDLQLANENIEERAATLYSSMLLRHGVDIKYIVKTAKKVNDNITSFSSAMCRILSKYIEKEEVKGEVCPECGGKLLRDGGCIKCLDCGWSRCS